MIEDFESRWRELIADGAMATREVDASAPLRMIFGLDSLGRPLFFVVVNQKPGLPHLKGAVSVERRFRNRDNSWTLSLVLEAPALTEVFLALVLDLARSCGDEPTESAAMATLLNTVDEWQTLLDHRTDRLSDSRLRGLMAELWFGFLDRPHARPLPEAVDAWGGPYGNEQDFVFPGGQAYEVKAVRPNRDFVEISSEAQLDVHPLSLAVVTIDAGTTLDNWTLPTLLETIRKSIVEPSVRTTFNRALLEYHTNFDDAWYEDQAFEFTRLRVYDVHSGFPALRGSNLPEAISRTVYRVDLNYTDEFLITDEPYNPHRQAGSQHEAR